MSWCLLVFHNIWLPGFSHTSLLASFPPLEAHTSLSSFENMGTTQNDRATQLDTFRGFLDSPVVSPKGTGEVNKSGVAHR